MGGCKKILITLHSLVEFAGAEMSVVSIARELMRLGYQIEIATFNYNFPIKKLCEYNELNVKNVLMEELDHYEFELIWAHHAPVLNYLLFEKGVKANKVVFSCLSPFEPLESPPIYINELTYCLANSYETRDQLIKEGVLENKIKYFPNFAPPEFMNNLNSIERLHRIVIVSNHVPQELIEATDVFKVKGIEVDIIGINFDHKEVTPELLVNYDAVITIGKTVQYAMAMAIPVYCYDVHGGPGWINLSNYEIAKYYNFSGRGFNNYFNCSELVDDVLNGFDNTLKETHDIQVKAHKEFNLSSKLKAIVAEVIDAQNIVLENVKINNLVIQRMNQAFMREYEYKYYYKGENHKNIEDVKKLSEKVNRMKKKEDQLLSSIEDVEKTLEMKIIELGKLDGIYRQIEERYNELSIKYKDIEKTNNENTLVISQLENNCNYLSELVAEKTLHINLMQSTKLWRIAEVLRKNKNKLRKLIKDPSLIIRKLRKRHTDFSPKVSISPNIHPELYNQELPLVSVVIPIYDRTEVLIESIESILNQSYENIEIILVCDGSPEETLSIVRSYESHPKIRVYYFKNNSGNAVRGRNKAIKEAKGKYLAFQDSDDVADVDRIKKSIEYAETYDADVVYGGWRALVDGTRELDLKNNQEVFSPECDYNLLKEICVPCQSTVMAKTEALRNVGGLKTIMKYREDHELWLRLAYYQYKFKAIPEILTNLRLHANNLELSFKDNDSYWESLTMHEHKIIRPLRPKIAYVIAGCGISGGLAVICNHANGLLDRGYDVLIITEDFSTSIDWFPNQRVPVISIKEIPNNIDIVVATYWTTAYTIDNIPSSKKFYFIQSDESKFFDINSKESIAAEKTYYKDHTFITMAKWLQEMLLEKYNKQAKYVPNGVDLSIVHKVVPLEKKTSKVRVLLEGPIDAPFKGMKEAFRVVEDLDCEVWCVSTAGKPASEWKCDKFFENVPMEKMKYIYSSCDILLKMSSIESFCLPALEMMACGGVCVLNRFNGLEEFVLDGYNGLVVDLGDINGAKVAIQRLIDDKSLRKRLSENSIQTASQWSWKRSIDQLENIFYPPVTVIEELMK